MLPPTPRRRTPHGTMRIRVGAFTMTKTGASRYDLTDPYHIAVSQSWPGFLLIFAVLEVTINFIFAGLYLLQPGSIANAHPGSLADAFFFSLETLATVGYGVMAPQTFYAHIITSVEIICGMAFVAIMTGLTFVRFSRPRAKVLYAESVVVSTHNGRPTLMIRIGNGRVTLLMDCKARLNAMIPERTLEGTYYRRVHDLQLTRDRLPIFPLTWTLMHVIDERSPLHPYMGERFAEHDIRLFLAIEARDPNLAAQIYDMKDYGKDQVVFGRRYADAVSIDEHGNTIADLGRISLLEDEVAMNSAVAAVAE